MSPKPVSAFACTSCDELYYDWEIANDCCPAEFSEDEEDEEED